MPGPNPRRLQNNYEKRTEKEMQGQFIAAFMDVKTILAASIISNVPISRVNKWRLLDENFNAAFEEVLAIVCQALEDEAYRRAVLGVKKPVYQGGKYVGDITEYSDSLLIFLMKGKMPDTYRDKLHVEKNTNTSNTVLVLPSNGRELTSPVSQMSIATQGSVPIEPVNVNRASALGDYLESQDISGADVGGDDVNGDSARGADISGDADGCSGESCE